MNLHRLGVALVFAVMPWAAPARAQPAPPPPPAEKQFARARVMLADREVHGRLIRFDSQTVTIEVDKRQFDLPMADVRQIDVKERDSLRNGALFGALYVAACAKWWCGQGLDGPSEGSMHVVLGAGMGALVGAGIDALFSRRKTLYKAGVALEPRPLKGGIAFSLRF